jgi:hypothetical protein
MSIVKCSAFTDYTSSTATPTVTVPTGPTAPVPGDIGYVLLGGPSATLRTITPPAGWTVVEANALYGNMNMAIFSRIYQTGDSATAAFTTSVADLWSILGFWVDSSQVDSVDKVGTAGSRGGVSGATVIAPAVLGEDGGETALAVFAERSTAVSTATVNHGTQDLYQEFVGSTVSFLVTEQFSATSSLPAVTATYTASSTNAMGVQIAFRPFVPLDSGVHYLADDGTYKPFTLLTIDDL